jgi:hypothetical protein
MGCNLTNFQIRNGGDSYWRKFATKNIDQLGIPEEERQELRRRCYFKANPDIDWVVFLCGPHRGAPMANSIIGRLEVKLIRAPFQVVGSLTAGLGDGLTPVPIVAAVQQPSTIERLNRSAKLFEIGIVLTVHFFDLK